MPGLNYTPGPWYVLSDFQIAAKPAGTEEILAGVNEDDFRLDLDEDSALDEAKANGRLMAAAPDLLEAAQMALTDLEAMYPMLHAPGTVSALRYAINKATPRIT